MTSRRSVLKTQYHLHRTDTDRLSSGTDPSEAEKKNRKFKVAQMQNIPKPIRRMFRADPGFVMLGVDWAAIQWAIMMWKAAEINEPAGYHAELLYRHQLPDGHPDQLDPHRFLASHFKGNGGDESKVTDAQRQLAKSFTYGRGFYGKDKVLAKEAKVTLREGQEICQTYDNAMKIKPFWTWIRDSISAQGFLETPHKFRMWFFDPVQLDRDGFLKRPKMQEAVARWVQGTEAGILKQTLVRLFYSKPDWFEVLTTTHDNIVGQVPLDREEEGKEFLLACAQAPVPFMNDATWRGEVKSGDNWMDVS